MPSALAPTELRGFLLTRHWRDLPGGTEIEYWLATDDGPKKVLLTQQTSVAFLPVRHRAAAQVQLANLQGLEVKELGLKTFEQEPVLGVYARRFRDLGKLARALQPPGTPLYEAHVRPHDRYLMERFITAGVLIEGGQREGSTIVDGRLKPASGWRPVLKVVSLDIETSATEELYSIALDGAGDRVVFMLGEAPVAASESAPALSSMDFRLVYCLTSIEWDHKLFRGFLKVSLEEVLIALRDDRRLLNDPHRLFAGNAGLDQGAEEYAESGKDDTLYRDGFSAGQFFEVIETAAVWAGSV